MKSARTVSGIVMLWLLALPLLAAAPRDISKDYRRACDMLVCQCGCNEQLSVCAMQNCGSATPMRAEIRARLERGETVDAIVASFVARMGKQVLSAPTMQGFDLTAWVLPFFFLSLGLIVVSLIVVRMVRPAVAAVDAIPAIQDPRVEKELMDFEEES